MLSSYSRCSEECCQQESGSESGPLVDTCGMLIRARLRAKWVNANAEHVWTMSNPCLVGSSLGPPASNKGIDIGLPLARASCSPVMEPLSCLSILGTKMGAILTKQTHQPMSTEGGSAQSHEKMHLTMLSFWL